MKSIMTQLEDIAAEMCEDYCKVPIMTCNSETRELICKNCPMNRLTEDFEHAK